MAPGCELAARGERSFPTAGDGGMVAAGLEGMSDAFKDVSKPDTDIHPWCKARDLGLPDFVECLCPEYAACRHALGFGYSILCRHPLRREIVRRTEVPRHP